jgi:hypothetical protein
VYKMYYVINLQAPCRDNHTADQHIYLVLQMMRLFSIDLCHRFDQLRELLNVCIKTRNLLARVIATLIRCRSSKKVDICVRTSESIITSFSAP